MAISSHTGEGIEQLKDMLWVELNKEQNQIIEISHAPIDVARLSEESEDSDYSENSDEEEGTIYLNEVEEEWDLDKYKGIGWDN